MAACSRNKVIDRRLRLPIRLSKSQHRALRACISTVDKYFHWPDEKLGRRKSAFTNIKSLIRRLIKRVPALAELCKSAPDIGIITFRNTSGRYADLVTANEVALWVVMGTLAEDSTTMDATVKFLMVTSAEHGAILTGIEQIKQVELLNAVKHPSLAHELQGPESLSPGELCQMVSADIGHAGQTLGQELVESAAGIFGLSALAAGLPDCARTPSSVLDEIDPEVGKPFLPPAGGAGASITTENQSMAGQAAPLSSYGIGLPALQRMDCMSMEPIMEGM